MDATIYFDLARKDAFESLNGGSRFEFPPLAYGEQATIRGRFATRTASGDQVEVSRVAREVRASIGKVDARPESGDFKIKIGPLGDADTDGVNVTESIPFNADASDVQSALNALSLVGTTYGNASVISSHGSWIVTFEDEAGAVEINAASNSLFPLSFLRVRAHEFNGQWQHDLRLIQAPVASTDQSARVVPKGPEITEKQAGFDNGDNKFPEIQRLYIPPTFRGVYQIRRGFDVSPLLKAGGSDADGAEEIQEAITGLADENSGWSVTNPSDGVALLTATGDWVGEDLDLLSVDIFEAPEGDLTFTLDLNTPEMFTLLRAKESVALPIEIEADIEDEQDENTVRTVKLFRGEVEVFRELHWEELSVAANIDWLRPPLPKNYKPFSVGQISNGQLHHSEPVGDGTLSTYTIDHNLDTDKLTVIVHPNTAAGSPLVYGTDYTYTRTNSNTLDITFTSIPGVDEFFLVVLGLEQTSFFDSHTHEIAEVNGLQSLIDSLGSRVTALEDRSGGGAIPQSVGEDSGESARWQLPSIFEIYPTRETVPDPEAGLHDLDTSVLPRARGLLPAIHDAAVEAMPSTVATAEDSDKGRVLENQGSDTILVPVGLGHRSAKVKPGEFIASDGRVWYPVTQYGAGVETTYYPSQFERELFTIHVNENQLRTGKALSVNCALQAAVVGANTAGQWSLVMELGEATQEDSPATTGTNLKDLEWRAEPILEQRLIITPVTTTHRFGIKLDRYISDGSEAWKAVSLLYGATSGNFTPPTTANFSLRARLVRFDTEDGESDPRGFVAIKGLNFDADSATSNEGFAIIP